MALIKGTAMLQCVKLCQAQREKDRALLFVSFGTLEKRMPLSIWYTEEDHLALRRVVAKWLSTRSAPA